MIVQVGTIGGLRDVDVERADRWPTVFDLREELGYAETYHYLYPEDTRHVMVRYCGKECPDHEYLQPGGLYVVAPAWVRSGWPDPSDVPDGSWPTTLTREQATQDLFLVMTR